MKSRSQKNKGWHVLADTLVFETPWFGIRKQHLQMPSGKELDYYIHDAPDSVICVCVNKDGALLVEQQYRPPVGKISIDYPAGSMEKNDATTEKAILRELQEETGFSVHSLHKLAAIDKDPGFSKSRMHVFLARGEVTGAPTPDETENIIITFVKPPEILEMITSGKMACVFCISATFFAFKELGWLNGASN